MGYTFGLTIDMKILKIEITFIALSTNFILFYFIEHNMYTEIYKNTYKIFLYKKMFFKLRTKFYPKNITIEKSTTSLYEYIFNSFTLQILIDVANCINKTSSKLKKSCSRIFVNTFTNLKISYN